MINMPQLGSFIALPFGSCIATARPFSLPISELHDYRQRILLAPHLPCLSTGAADTQPAHLSSVFLCGCRQSCEYYLSWARALLPFFRALPTSLMTLEKMSQNLRRCVRRTELNPIRNLVSLSSNRDPLQPCFCFCRCSVRLLHCFFRCFLKLHEVSV